MFVFPKSGTLNGASPSGASAINFDVAQLSGFLIQMLTWAIIARMLLTWFPIDQNGPLFQTLVRVTEPLIQPLRKLMPSSGMLDFSPMLAIIVLIVLGGLVSGLAQPA